MRKRTAACVLCPVVLLALAAPALAQREDDPLARARAKARAENQRVLLFLTGGDSALETALAEAFTEYAALGKLLRYEFQLAALPGDSQPGMELRQRLQLDELALPAIAVLDTSDSLLGAMPAERMVAAEGEGLDLDAVRAFLQGHECPPLDARKVLADGIAEAKRSARHAFVYLSAPW